MILLALETATEACSVALWIDGEVRERFEVAPRRHTELVLPWIDALLADAGLRKAQIDALACGRGPGAFTGVRLAVAMTQGLALALDRPVLGISTLAALALTACGDPDCPAGTHYVDPMCVPIDGGADRDAGDDAATPPTDGPDTDGGVWTLPVTVSPTVQ